MVHHAAAQFLLHECQCDSWQHLKNGMMAHQAASLRGHLPVLELLIKRDRQLMDAPNSKVGLTALHYAAQGNQWEVVKWLRRAGAAVLQESHGTTDGMQAMRPSEWAQYCNREGSMADYLRLVEKHAEDREKARREGEARRQQKREARAAERGRRRLDGRGERASPDGDGRERRRPGRGRLRRRPGLRML